MIITVKNIENPKQNIENVNVELSTNNFFRTVMGTTNVSSDFWTFLEDKPILVADPQLEQSVESTVINAARTGWVSLPGDVAVELSDKVRATNMPAYNFEPGHPVVCSLFIKIDPTIPYHVFHFEAEVISSSPTTRIFRLNPAVKSRIMSWTVNNVGDFYRPAEAGILMLSFKLGLTSDASRNTTEGWQQINYATIAVPYSHVSFFQPDSQNPANIQSAEPGYTTTATSFETLFVPVLTGTFVYNFYEPKEGSETDIQNRDYSGESLSKIPKYVNLAWTKSPNVVRFPLPPPVPIDVQFENTSTRDDIRTGGSNTGTAINRFITPLADSTNLDAAQTGYNSDGSFYLNYSGFTQPAGFQGNQLVPYTGQQASESGTQESDVFNAQPGTTSTIQEAMSAPPTVVLRGYPSRYVGYVIKKERYNEETEEFEHVTNIVIKDRERTFFTDWKVVYGEIYRYSVRSLFLFVNSLRLPVIEDSEASVSESSLEHIFGLSNELVTNGYYFDSDFSDAMTFLCIDEERPSPPFNINIIANSFRKTAFVTWNQKNTDKDLSGFNVYRKDENKGFFVLMNESLLPIRSNFFLDKNLELDSKYIYAIESVDVHGLMSKLSAMYSIQLSSDVSDNSSEIFKKEVKQKFEWPEGQEIDSSLISNEKDDRVYFNKYFDFYVNPSFSLNQNTNFIFKVSSLDTGQTKELKLSMTSRTIDHRVNPRNNDNRTAARQYENLQVESETIETGSGNPFDRR